MIAPVTISQNHSGQDPSLRALLQQDGSPHLSLLTFTPHLNVCNVHQHPTTLLGSVAFTVLFQVLSREKSQQNDTSFTVQLVTT